VVSALDSGAPGAWAQIAAATLSGNSLGQTVHTHRASVHQAAKLVAALLMVARVTAGLTESNGSLYRRVYDSHHLQAECQEPGSDRLWAILFYIVIYKALLYGRGRERQQNVNRQWPHASLKTRFFTFILFYVGCADGLWQDLWSLDFEKLRHGSSAVATDGNVVRPTTVASLSH